MNQPLKTRRPVAIATLVCCALVLGGCGRKGALEPPGADLATSETAPVKGSKVAAPAANAGTATTKGKTDPGPVPPQKSIVLDKLL